MYAIFYMEKGLVTFETREEMLNIFPKGGTWVELGVFKGDFAESMYKAGNPQDFILVDLWPDNNFSGDVNGNGSEIFQGDELYEIVKGRFINNKNIHVIRNLTHIILNKIPDGEISVIYIDADHSYEGVKRDLALCKTKVKKGGWICGHDYLINGEKATRIYKFGVRKAVDEFCKENGLYIKYLAMDGYVSYAIQNV